MRGLHLETGPRNAETRIAAVVSSGVSSWFDIGSGARRNQRLLDKTKSDTL